MSKFAYPRMLICMRIPARVAPRMRIHMRTPVPEDLWMRIHMRIPVSKYSQMWTLLRENKLLFQFIQLFTDLLVL